MAVDSVNNNRTATITATAAAVGAGAGAAYGYSSSNILEGKAPKDSFVRTLDSNKVSQQKKALNDMQSAYKGISESGSVEKASDEIKAGLKKAGGKGFKLEEAAPEKIKELAKGLLLSDEAKKLELTKIEDASLSVLQRKAAGLKEVSKEATLEDLQKIIKNNHELFEIKKTEKGTLDDAVKAFVKDKELVSLRETVTNTIADNKKAIEKQITSRQKSLRTMFSSVYDIAGKKMKELPKDASESAKSTFKTVKNAIKNFKAFAALKWAGIGAGIIGLTSFVTAKITGKAADKAIAQAQEECECPECEDCE